MTIDVKSLLSTGAALTDAALERLLPSATTEPHSIHRAMRHSTFAGGKRLRPILCMEASRMIAGNLPEGAAEVGAAIEMLHTYSLIHDDLPALDNDDLRRGQPTCHVKYGEDVAILAGDGLFAEAVRLELDKQEGEPSQVLAGLRHLGAGVSGSGEGGGHDRERAG